MKILFMGDSITDCNRVYDDFYNLGDGYVMYTTEALKENLPEIDFEFINKGISGNRTCDILARSDADLIDHNPDIVTILIGTNDTWRRYDMNDPTSAEQFSENYEAVLKKIKEKTNAKIVILEMFLIYNMGRDEYRVDLDEKINATRQLAFKYADAYVPLDGILAAEAVHTPVNELSPDGIHLGEAGKKVVANALAPVIEKLIIEHYAGN